MDTGTIVSVLVVAAIALGALVLRRRRAVGDSGEDTGSALVDFGTAFPDAAVRDVVRTSDGRSTFLRLADGRTGLVMVEGRRHALQILEPGLVRVEGPAGECGLTVSFRGDEERRETFLFARPEDAAEVSLWLCASIARAGGKR